TRQKGSGLGLSISKSIVELHGGCMQVESEPDQGSTFTFTVPTFTPFQVLNDEINRKLAAEEQGESFLLCLIRLRGGTNDEGVARAGDTLPDRLVSELATSGLAVRTTDLVRRHGHNQLVIVANVHANSAPLLLSRWKDQIDRFVDDNHNGTDICVEFGKAVCPNDGTEAGILLDKAEARLAPFSN
ncbi:MAG: hypothetical protein K9N51_11800, partial [Candidatus Pacebacteria bacterium]|nr:hypothetical protein [Candidatus Paceibacterota bacterium]